MVAVEGSWGDLARELGGDRVEVRILVDEPSIDPHDYEPTTRDALDLATARLAVLNGVGYDAWATKLLDANPVDGRAVLVVGEVAHVPDDGNPHQWYSPQVVGKVATAITRELIALDPRARPYFELRRRRLDDVVLARYHEIVDAIRARYAGTPVGATESIAEPLAHALGLDLVTPHRFLTAAGEGADPSAADKATVDRQLARRAMEVLLVNPQNGSPDVQRLVDAAHREHIPVVELTETAPVAHESFATWQVRQLEALQRALSSAAAT